MTPLIHVVEGDEALRTALLRLLGAAGYDARGYASTADFLLQPLPDRPGCLLLDVGLLGPSGLDVQAALSRQGNTLPVVFLTGRVDAAMKARVIEAGAVDVLSKPVERGSLLGALKRALVRNAGERAKRSDSESLLARISSLSERERQVFERVVAGKLNQQIADELGIAERTVKAQRAQMMQKLGADSAAALGRVAEQWRTLFKR